MPRAISFLTPICLCAAFLTPLFADPPVRVTIQDEKPKTEEAVLPLDPVKHVIYQSYAGMALNVRVDNQTMHLGQIATVFKIGGAVVFPTQLGLAKPIGKKAADKKGEATTQVVSSGSIQITQTVEVVPSKPARPEPGAKRRLDTVLVRYAIENKDTRPHQVGTRVYMNTMIVTSRTALFAAPNQPGKILNGVELKDANVPDYLQILQNPDLKNPGRIGTMTYRFGRKWEAPNRVVLTRIGAPGDGWNFNALPAGNSALAVYWDPAEIKPGGKRELAYAYGGGIAAAEGDSHFALALGGSFEPGKLFTITAEVTDPSPGQSLTLELPDGMQRVEGKERQPVPLAAEENPSVVVWKARVLRMGDFRVRVRSSAGMSVSKLVSITQGN